jgi:TonB family protein
MRTNKFIPFYIALSLHAIPLIYFLSKKHAPPIPISAGPTSKMSPYHRLDLNGFSISQKLGKSRTQMAANNTKKVGLSAGHSNGPASDTGQSKFSEPGMDSGTSKNSTGLSFINFHEPQYPVVARQKGHEGVVKIKAYYNQEGLITKVEIVESSGIKMLDETVKKAAAAWRLKTNSAGSFEKKFEFKLKN